MPIDKHEILVYNIYSEREKKPDDKTSLSCSYDNSKADKTEHDSRRAKYQIQRRTKTMSQNEITAKVREIKELQRIMDEAAAEIEALKDAIKAHMDAENVEELTADIYKVRYTAVKSSRFDTTTFKKEAPELYAKYAKETISCRFTIA